MFKQKDLWVPIALYLVLIIPVTVWDVDWTVANWWYQWEGNAWTLRNDWFTQKILHDVGHDVAVGFYVLILLTYIISLKLPALARYKYGFAYLSLSLPVATLSVSSLKQLTRLDCPWSMIDFGGDKPYQLWIESLWSPITNAGHCFPSGHASSAYMMFGLYFFSRHYWPSISKWILASVILLGLIFGIAQQARGAHFISHDLTSALVCWLVSWFIWHIRVNTWTKSADH